MNDMPHKPASCILSDERAPEADSILYTSLPEARCRGILPLDPLDLFPLCLQCDLLHRHGSRDHFTRIASSLAESRQQCLRQKRLLESGMQEIHETLGRLSIGDPDVQVPLYAGEGMLAGITPVINRLADFLKGIIDESHETAIGLCEHYETLLRQADGELEARASESSPIELIARLGELINRQAATFREVIRQLRLQEQELHTLSQLQQAIIDFLPDATFVIDTDHRVIAWNRAIEKMTGVAKQDMHGKGDYEYSIPFYGIRRPILIDFIGRDLDPSAYSYFKREGDSITAEALLPALNDIPERYIWLTASPLYDLEGTRIGAIESVRDITYYKKSETEKETLRDQLHHAQKLDSIGQLAGGVAHEFNNVLAAIIGYAGLLESRLGPDSPHLAPVQRIISAAEKAASLVRSMLAFSRKQILAIEPVHLNLLILEMQEMLRRLAGENILLDFRMEDHDFVIRADQGQIQQILLNLYNNARDAMPDGGVLTISTSRRLHSGRDPHAPAGLTHGSYILLAVSDTGCGICRENLNRIFDPFFTTKEIGKGTGLGLSMVFGIVRQHEGAITVKSEPGTGSTFTVWFPEQVQHAVSAAPSGTEEPSRASGQRHATILVGEDNDDLRPMIAELLKDAGYSVIEACDGMEVVAVMENMGENIDLLLLDVIMPHMNGFEALTAVRTLYPGIPCIFLSGYSDDFIRQKGGLTDTFEYLNKPVQPDVLIEAVRSALEKA